VAEWNAISHQATKRTEQITSTGIKQVRCRNEMRGGEERTEGRDRREQRTAHCKMQHKENHTGTVNIPVTSATEYRQMSLSLLSE